MEEPIDVAVLVDFGMIEEPGFLDEEMPSDHDENLAEEMEDDELKVLAGDIIEMVQEDLKSRENWEKLLEKGLDMFGLTEDQLDKQTTGRATVTHPLLIEAAIQFQARAIEELFPAAGPVKSFVLGEATEERIDRAQRVEAYMNHHLVSEDLGYFPDTDKMLFSLAHAGSMFRKVYRDDYMDRNTARSVAAKDFIVNNSTNLSLEDAHRYTHRIPMHPNDVKIAQAAGIYRAYELPGPGETNDNSTLADKEEEVTGLKDTDREEDDTYNLYETYLDLEISVDPDVDMDGEPTGIARPYVVTVEASTETVLAIRRNWAEDDEKKRPVINFIHYQYEPGIGFYGHGLPHLIGGLSRAATDSLRSLLDSATFSSFQGGFVAKDVAVKHGEYSLKQGVWQQIEATGEDIQKAFYTPPFKEPSPAMFQLLGLLQDLGRRFASTTEAMVGNADNRGPVGTTVALIEQGSKIYSAIHKRLHHAQGQEFQLLFNLHGEHMPEDGYPYPVEGSDNTIFAEDFAQDVGVRPVSDPNIISQAQRIAMEQGLMELAMMQPELYDMKKAHERMLEAMRVPAWEEVLVNVEDITTMDPVSENMAVMLGKPIKAGVGQDHQSHLAAHMAFLQHPQFGGEPNVSQVIAPAMAAHLAEHLALHYQFTMQGMGVPINPVNMGAEIGEPFAPADPQADMAIAQAAVQMLEQFKQATGVQTPPPPPPAPSKAELAMQLHQVNMQIKQEEHQFDMMAANQKLQVEIQRKQVEGQVTAQTRMSEAQQELERKGLAAQQDMKLKESKHILESKVIQQDRAGQGAIAAANAMSESNRKAQAGAAQAEQDAASFEEALAQDEEKHQQELRQAAEEHAQKMMQDKEVHVEDVKEKTETAKAAREDASYKVVSDAKVKEKTAVKKEAPSAPKEDS
jgi:hypothetical protein